MRAENLTFPEAARKLAERLGVELKGRAGDRPRARAQGPAGAHQRRGRAVLSPRSSTRAPAPAITCASGGCADDLIARFGIGWAPAGVGPPYGTCAGRATRTDIEKSGLCVARPRGDGCYDRFRGRVMFPILDSEERVIGFGGRILEGDEAKYINSPETALFRKGRTLYAFPLARKAMGERGRAIVVEGYFDAIACHAAGFTETVATLGTALTQEHLEVLRRTPSGSMRRTTRDSAGMKAVLRSQELFEAARLEVRVVRLPPGARSRLVPGRQGPQALAREIEHAVTADGLPPGGDRGELPGHRRGPAGADAGGGGGAGGAGRRGGADSLHPAAGGALLPARMSNV